MTNYTDIYKRTREYKWEILNNSDFSTRMNRFIAPGVNSFVSLSFMIFIIFLPNMGFRSGTILVFFFVFSFQIVQFLPGQPNDKKKKNTCIQCMEMFIRNIKKRYHDI